jgi:Na+/melibiose symporter-like transporter
VDEHSPNKQRGFWASWPQAAVTVGNMLATVVLWVLTATLPEQAALVGWRASPDAGMVTGASYPMDGGWSAR